MSTLVAAGIVDLAGMAVTQTVRATTPGSNTVTDRSATTTDAQDPGTGTTGDAAERMQRERENTGSTDSAGAGGTNANRMTSGRTNALAGSTGMNAG